MRSERAGSQVSSLIANVTGGLSYFGAAHGFGCDTVQNFEVVLADGSIVNANEVENTDLFTVLKGGSNNFGIVTSVDLKTFELGDFWGGQLFYFAPETPALLDAFAEYAASPDFDPKSFVLMSTLYSSASGLIATADFSYAEDVDNPEVFSNFTSVPSILNETRISNLTDFAESLGAFTPNNLR